MFRFDRSICRSLLGGMFVALALTGCQVVTPSPTWQTAQAVFPSPWQSEVAPALDPRFEYLTLAAGAKPIYLALGYRADVAAAGAAGAQGPRVLEHWYSAGRELLVLEDGRIQQALGVPIEWRAVRPLGLPRWHELVAGDAKPRSWRRSRDEMPGYRYDVVDLVRTQRVDAVRESVPSLPVGVATRTRGEVIWMRDDIRSTLADGQSWQYSQWFALSEHRGAWRVVWSRQCLAPNWCLDLYPVPAPAS